MHDAQAHAGVPEHQILATKRPSETRWGGHYLLLHANCLLRPALQQAVDDFKAGNRNIEEAIVEFEDDDESGSKVGKAVPTSALGVTAEQWEDSLHLESFLKKCYDVKESMEHKGYLTGAQSMMVIHTLMKEAAAGSLSILKFPVSLTVDARLQRTAERIEKDQVCALVQQASNILRQELQDRFFTWRPSNSRLVLGYMSKQKKPEKWLTREQVDLAKTCYFTMLRESDEILKGDAAKVTEKKRSSPRLAKKRKLIADSDSDEDFEVLGIDSEARADVEENNKDSVTDEIDSWKHMSREKYKVYEDEDGIINEFQMMWELRLEFPHHYIVFLQCAAHLLHEANVEQIFSLAGFSS